MRSPLVLTEYAPSPAVQLSVTQRDTLRQLVRGLRVEPVHGSTDTYVLTPGSMVGVVRVGDLSIELRPKVGSAPVVFMLSYALDPRAWQAAPGALTRDATLAEAVVPLFASTVERAIRSGLLHGYRVRHDTLDTIRGRVKFADQMRARTGLPLPVEVVHDEFTADILENRLLRTAVDTLGQLRLRHAASRTTLGRLHQQLNGVGRLIVAGNFVPEPVWTRLNERYRPAVALARVIITLRGLEAQAQGQDVSAFLVDMNAVFERFVRVALREELALPQASFPAGARGHRTFLDTGNEVPLEPDLSWWTGRQCLFVGDCKYKRTIGSVPNADIYQMLAYLTALRLSDGLLVYAAGEAPVQDIDVERAGKRIHIRTLDVANDPHVVLGEVRRLARFVRHLAAQGQGER